MTKIKVALVCLLGALLIIAGLRPAAAADRDITAFYGSYVGESIRRGTAGVALRDLKVTIRPTEGGFNVSWDTAIHDQGNEVRKKSYSINFRPTARPGIFASEMRHNKFGGMVPLDPFKGEPLIWARLHGDTLTVYGMHITEQGGYEMQVYDRKLTAEGLSIHFKRMRDDNPILEVEGTLRRTGP